MWKEETLFFIFQEYLRISSWLQLLKKKCNINTLPFEFELKVIMHITKPWLPSLKRLTLTIHLYKLVVLGLFSNLVSFKLGLTTSLYIYTHTHSILLVHNPTQKVNKCIENFIKFCIWRGNHMIILCVYIYI